MSQKYRLEADYGRDFVLTETALREDYEACAAVVRRAEALVAQALG